jgi:arylesterase / paraoxonase
MVAPEGRLASKIAWKGEEMMTRERTRGRRIRWMLAGALLAMIAVYGYLIALKTGQFRKLEAKAPGPCKRLEGFIGPEDIAIDQRTGMAFVSVVDRIAVAHGQGAPNGNILRLDLTQEEPRPVLLNPLPPESFSPHGLDLFIDEVGRRWLFVINHGATGKEHSVEIFRVTEDSGLEHVRSVHDELIYSPNDVAATSPDSFYISNDLGARTAFLRTLEPLLMAPWANLIYFDGTRAREAAGGFQYANGVMTSEDGGLVFVAEVMGRQVNAFERQRDTGALTPAWSVDLPFGVDNLTLGPEGAIWAAGHPRPLEFTRHEKDVSQPSSSEVARIDWRGRAVPQVTTIYLDRGGGISGSSVAAVYKGRLYIGAVFSRYLLRCELTSPPPSRGT